MNPSIKEASTDPKARRLVRLGGAGGILVDWVADAGDNTEPARFCQHSLVRLTAEGCPEKGEFVMTAEEGLSVAGLLAEGMGRTNPGKESQHQHEQRQINQRTPRGRP